jgi:hypothetical protein
MRERLLDRPGPIDSLKQTGCAVKLQAPPFAAPLRKFTGFFHLGAKRLLGYYGLLSAINYQEALAANRQSRGAVDSRV